MPTPIKTFIFDLDGTLLDTLPDLVVLTNSVLEEFGFPPRSRDEIHSFVGNGVRALILQAVPKGTPEQIADQALERWKQKNSTYANDLTKPYPHMIEALKALKKRRCMLGVVSNKYDGGVTQIINQCMPNIFDVLHGESDDIPRKPNPKGVTKTMAELNATRATTAYIGDSPTDVRTARNAEVMAIAVTWGYHTRDYLEAAKPDLIIDDPRQLLTLTQ